MLNLSDVGLYYPSYDRAGFSRLKKAEYSGGKLGVELERIPEYTTDCFGILSTLETEREIAGPWRSQEVASLKGMYGAFGGAPNFNERPLDFLVKRMYEETGHEVYDYKVLGLLSDRIDRNAILFCRGFVDEIKTDRYPRSFKNKHGVQKYVGIETMDKSDLAQFLKQEKGNIVPTVATALGMVRLQHETGFEPSPVMDL